MNFSTEHSILSKFYLEETDAGKSLQLDSFMKLFLAYLARKKYVWIL
jgi:flagellar hook assembly protein FlgD